MFQPLVPKLTIENSNDWCVQMHVLLAFVGVWELVVDGYKEPDGEEAVVIRELKDQLKISKRRLTSSVTPSTIY